MDRTIIIAEIGECFNGNLDTAKKLIFVAKEAGCDIAKFQTLDYENISEDDPERDWFKKIALTPQKIGYLIKCAREIGIGILFSPENIKTAKWLLGANCKDIKIASSSITDMKLIKFAGRHFKRIFISTGMASIPEVKKAIRHLHRVPDLYVMHCVSEYPTGPLLCKKGLVALSPEDAHLNMMKMLMKVFPEYKIGYSDHTSGIFVPVLAVAAGARVIEKHISLDVKTPIKNFMSGRKYLGTDHVLSLEPPELKEMVKHIREAEKILGKWKWQRSSGEKILKKFIRSRFSH